MANPSTFPGPDAYGSRSAGGEVNIAVDPAQRRAQIEREQQERAAERQQLLSLQSSPHSTPEERVRLWERLHGLTLPRAPTHPLLHVIAKATELSIGQMHELQQRRAAAHGRSAIVESTDASSQPSPETLSM
jgi:hypothetical protein